VSAKVGAFVWHTDTGAGPWLVLKVDKNWLVYVDSNPGRPATKTSWSPDAGRNVPYVSLTHEDVEVHYAKMLTTTEPTPKPPKIPWHATVDWERLGQGFGMAMWICGLLFLTAVYLWVEWST
jgi:hypothetical protein